MRLNIIKICMIGGLTFFSSGAVAQIAVRPLSQQNSIANIHQRKLSSNNPIFLPFWDDFSFSQGTPNTKMWAGFRGVVVNNTQAISPPSFNVATFDGYNDQGVAYSQGFGLTDTLTSNPINLKVVSQDKRNSVILSFYWQNGGASDHPEDSDYLQLELKKNDGTWVALPKIRLEATANVFTKQSYQLMELDEDYFHSGFQFRFSAFGNLGGAYDVWHIDYVYLNQDRVLSEKNENILDHAVTRPLTSIFSKYTMIPFDVFFNFSDTIFKDIQTEVFSLETAQDHQIDFSYKLYESPSFSSTSLQEIYSYTPVLTPIVGKLKHQIVTIPKLKSSVITIINKDSIFLTAEFIYKTNDSYFPLEYRVENGQRIVKTYLEDDLYNYRLNDTLRANYQIHQALAYDDGSAELAAGINKSGGELAVRYIVPSQDTITHVDIYFPSMALLDINSMTIKIMSDSFGRPNKVLRQIDGFIPQQSGLNEFKRFELSSPVIVSSTFYVVFQQYTDHFVPLGLDMNNTIGKSTILSKIDNQWLKNEKVEGILMIRPIFADSKYVVTTIATKPSSLVAVFPNPTNEALNIKGIFDSYQLVNLSGKIVIQGDDNEITVNHLKKGIYQLVVTNKTNRQSIKVWVAR